MDITPPRDSEGTEALRRSNKPAGVMPPGAIAPVRSLQASGDGRDRQPAPHPRPGEPDRDGWPHVERRRAEERRQGVERRVRTEPAWLDTRDHRERRTTTRRAADRELAADAPGPCGIDTSA